MASATAAFDVFICHEGTMKQIIAEPLKRIFTAAKISAFLDEHDLKPGTDAPQTMRDALLSAKVVVVAVDSLFFPRSSDCVEELQVALQKHKDGQGLLFPLFLSPFDTYPTTLARAENAVPRKRDLGKGMTYEHLALSFGDLCKITGMRVKEDKTFRLEHVVVSVEAFLNDPSKGERFNLQDYMEDEQIRQRARSLRLMAAGVSAESVYRMLNPIKLCLVPALAEKGKIVNAVHAAAYEELKAMLLDENEESAKSITGVGGAGGIGKTVLAKRLAVDPEVKDHFADGVLWLALGQEAKSNEEELLNLWKDLSPVDAAKDYLKPLKTGPYLVELLKGRNFNALIILDNVWTKEVVQVFEPVVEASVRTKLLITSRNKSLINQAFGAQCVSLNPSLEHTKEEALALMRAAAESSGQSASHLDMEDDEDMYRLAKVVGYHPKALSILCSSAADYESWDQFATQMESGVGLGSVEDEREDDAAAAAIDEVYKAIESTFRYRFKNSAEEKRELLSRLGVFVDDARFTLEDVAFVWETSILTARKTLNKFVDCSLVEKEESTSRVKLNTEYYLHDLVRDYARSKSANDYTEGFVKRVCDAFKKSKEKLTEYMFRQLMGNDTFMEDGAEVVEKAKEVHRCAQEDGILVDDSWRSNMYIVGLAACQNLASTLQVAEEKLFEKPTFFKYVLEMQAEGAVLDVTNSAWWSSKKAKRKFVQALETNTKIAELRIRLSRGDHRIISEMLLKQGVNGGGLKYLNDLPVGVLKGAGWRTTELVLSGERWSDVYLLIVARLVAENKSMRSLSLLCVDIDESCAAVLGDSLAQNKTLKNLILYGNGLGDDGLVRVLKCLGENTSCKLETLCVRANGISEKGAATAVKALKNNCTVREVDLSENGLKPRSVKALLRVMSVRGLSSMLHLSKSDIDSEEAQDIARIFHQSQNNAVKLLVLGARDETILFNEEFRLAMGSWQSHLSTLAKNLSEQGRYDEALPLYHENLGVCRHMYGSRSVAFATALDNLASLLYKQRKLAEARPMFEEAIAIWKEIYGEEHQLVATALNNLASLLKDQGKHGEAEKRVLEANEIVRRVLGTSNIDFARGLSTLASILRAQGRLKDAERLAREALGIYREILGQKHPLVAAPLNDLALLLQDQGKLDEAEPLFRQALTIDRKVYGNEHPHVGIDLNNLARVLYNQGKYDEAEPLYREALKISEKVYGTENPDYALSLNNLALLYKAQGQFKEAESMFRQAVAIGRKALGNEHPQLAGYLNNLAVFSQEQGNLNEAEQLMREVLGIDKKVLGEQHPDYALDLINLALVLSDKGNSEEALEHCQRALSVFKDVHGEKHPRVAKCYRNMARCFSRMGNYERATACFKLAIEIRKELTGEVHPEVAMLYWWFAESLKLEGLDDESKSVWKKACSIYEKKGLTLHPDYKSCLALWKH